MFSLLFAVRRRTTQIFFFIYLYSFCFTLCCFAFLTIQLRSTVDIYSLKTTLAYKQNCRTIERKLSQSATPNQNLLFFFTFTKCTTEKTTKQDIYIYVWYIYMCIIDCDLYTLQRLAEERRQITVAQRPAIASLAECLAHFVPVRRLGVADRSCIPGCTCYCLLFSVYHRTVCRITLLATGRIRNTQQSTWTATGQRVITLVAEARAETRTVGLDCLHPFTLEACNNIEE